MTRSRMYALTAAAAGLYIFLCWAFADGLFSLSGDALWNSDAIIESTIWTYVMLAAIVVAGLYEASKIPVEGVPVTVSRDVSPGQMDDPVFWKLAMGSTYYALLWLPLRFFVGREWAAAGEHKLRDDAWMKGGSALKGYWERATTVPEGRPTSPSGTYAWFEDFLKYMLDHEWYTWFAKVIAVGEFLVGIGLICRGTRRHRSLLRNADELQLPVGRLREHQPGTVRSRSLPGPRLEGCWLDRPGPLLAAGPGHSVEARAIARA